MALGVRLRKGTLLIALVLLLVGLGTGSASGATERLEEVSSFGFDHAGVDLAWDGEYLWTTDPRVDKIYKLDTNGNLISSFDSPDVIPRGITWDGEHLWVNSSSRKKIYEIDTSGNVISSFTTISMHHSGLAWDGEYLWSNETISSPYKIFEYDTSGNVVSSFDFESALGMACDGEYLWVATYSRNIYKLDTSGNVISSFDRPGPVGLTWDGEHLWVSDAAEDRIYQLRVTTDNETQFSLNVSLDPPEGGSVTLDPPGGTYPEGTAVTVTAVPAENYGFAGWSGDASGTSSTITVTMDSDKSVTAHFSKVEGPSGAEEGLPLVWVGAGLAAVVAVIAVVLLLRRR